MCATCEDRSSTNTKLCPVAMTERAKEAYEVVRLRGIGKTYPEIGEIRGIGVATAHKLFKLGIKQMAPPGAADEMDAIYLQLSQQYSAIQDDLSTTTDPGDKVKLYTAAIANIRERRKLFGAADLTIQHNVQTGFDAEMEELHRAFEQDQDIRNTTRSKRRAGR